MNRVASAISIRAASCRRGRIAIISISFIPPVCILFVSSWRSPLTHLNHLCLCQKNRNSKYGHPIIEILNLTKIVKEHGKRGAYIIRESNRATGVSSLCITCLQRRLLIPILANDIHSPSLWIEPSFRPVHLLGQSISLRSLLVARSQVSPMLIPVRIAIYCHLIHYTGS